MTKILSRTAIQRMVGAAGGSSAAGGGTGGGGSVDLTGYATEAWVDENYLSKSFFSTLFIIHATQTVTVTDDQGQPVGEPTVTEITLAPNLLPGTTSVTDSTTGYTTTTVIAITSIEAKSNFWSSLAISSLGLNSGGGGGGGASALYQLVDVKPNSSTTPTRVYGLDGTSADIGKVLMMGNDGKWYAGTVQSSGGSVTSITAGTGLSGGTITNSGTIGINSTYQSYITHGETAYGWGNHAGAGYLKSITSSMVTTALGFTPLSNATTFWGSGVSNGVVNGSITMLNGTGNGIYQKDIGGTARRVLSMDGGSPSGLYVGMDMLGYGTTFIHGNNISFAVGSSTGTDAMEITSAGRVHIKQGAQGLRIGDALLTWDSTNKVLNLTNVTTGQVAHFVASGGVTALQTS